MHSIRFVNDYSEVPVSLFRKRTREKERLGTVSLKNNDVYYSEWPHFRSLEFLCNHIAVRKSQSNLPETLILVELMKNYIYTIIQQYYQNLTKLIWLYKYKNTYTNLFATEFAENI